MQHALRSAAAAAALVAAISAQSASSDLLCRDVGLPLLTQQPPALTPRSFDEHGACVDAPPLSLDGYWDLSPTYQDMVARLFRTPKRRVPVHTCWLTKLTPQAAVLFTAAMQPNNSFQPQTRWSFTAGSGGGLQFGDPTVLRYSFVPDGTFIPPGVGEPGAGSNMFATLNAVSGSQTAWQNVIHSAFDRWGELTGLTCINDAQRLGRRGVPFWARSPTA